MNQWKSVLFSCALLWATTAQAEQYDVPIVVESEQDIRDLYSSGDITEEEQDRLLVLFDNPLDLNDADRSELYELPGLTYGMVDAIIERREGKGSFSSFQEIEDLEALSNNAINQIRTFCVVVPVKDFQVPPISGALRIGVVDHLSDDVVTGTFFRTKISVEDYVEVGWSGILAEEPGLLSFVASPDPANPNPYFLADEATLQFNGLAKLYASTDQRVSGNTRIRAIAGSYVVGFGERLTFDTTTRVNPNGWYADNQLYYSADQGSVTPRRGLFGGAVTVEKVSLGGDVTVDWTLFASRQRHRLYQYDFNLVVEGAKDPFESAKVYYSLDGAEEGPDGCYSGDRCHAYETFSEVYQETILGGNQTLRLGDRAQLGVTGFWAKNQFVVGDEQLVFAPSARYPQERKSLWAAGVDAAYGLGDFDWMGEWSTVDSGGHALFSRIVADLDPVEWELSGRYYQSEYDNPYMRGRAQRDEFYGLTARDEAGAKIRAVAKIFREWTLKSHVDVWKRLVAETWNLETTLRSDWDITRDIRWGTWFKLNDKDLSRAGRGEDYGESYDYEYDYDLNGLFISDYSELSVEDVGAGMKLDWGNRLSLNMIPLTRLSLYYKMSWEDENDKMSWADENATKDYPDYNTQFARRYVTAFAATVKPVDMLRLKTRFRLEDEYMLTDALGNKVWEWYFQTLVKLDKWASISGRYDYRDFIDDTPPAIDPEHLFRIIADFRF